MKTSKIRHIATGTDHDVPKEIVALGGVETTAWIENKMREEALQQSLKIAAAEEAARAATQEEAKSEIEQLKEIVLAQQAQLDHFPQNFVHAQKWKPPSAFVNNTPKSVARLKTCWLPSGKSTRSFVNGTLC